MWTLSSLCFPPPSPPSYISSLQFMCLDCFQLGLVHSQTAFVTKYPNIETEATVSHKAKIFIYYSFSEQFICLMWIRMEYLWSIFPSYSKACYSAAHWLPIPISTCFFLDVVFFLWILDMLCQFSCLTNCAYGLGILLVFYKFNRKKTQPQIETTTTLSCEAITLKWVFKLILS